MASTDQLRARGIYGAVVGKQPLGEGIALLGKLGVGAIEGVVRCSDVSDVCMGSGANFYFVDGQARVTAVPVWGLGVQLDMHTRFAARLEYERFGGVEFAREGHMLHVDYKLTTAGFLYKF